MALLHLLGTGAALSDASRTTTMLALESESVVVIDCGADAVQRLLAADVDLDRIALLILTHEHPDHVAGFPLFMEKIWLAQRRRPLPVRGPKPALDQTRKIFSAFNTSGWKGLPKIEWQEIEMREGAQVWEDDAWRITASPGTHSVPVIGIRAEDLKGGGTAVYSADTERADSIARLAQGATILVHEATGDFKGHASAAQAAELARSAGAQRLVLVHIPAQFHESTVEEARAIFPQTEVGADGGRYSF